MRTLIKPMFLLGMQKLPHFNCLHYFFKVPKFGKLNREYVCSAENHIVNAIEQNPFQKLNSCTNEMLSISCRPVC